MIAKIHLKPGKAIHLLRGHPWVYAQAVTKVTGKPNSGETIIIVDEKEQFIAKGAYSPDSSIRARVWHLDENRPVDDAFIKARVQNAVNLREQLIDKTKTNAYRVIFGEADGLPGFIADRYGDVLVCQITSAGAEKWRDAIFKALLKSTNLTTLYERSDAAIRDREGLPSRTGLVYGDLDQKIIPMMENGLHYGVDIVKGHKTGFYLDQRDNRFLLQSLAKDKSVLNCFCYTGGFSIAALAAGAKQVISIDSSGDALAQAQYNLKLNIDHDTSFKNNCEKATLEWIDQDVLKLLRQYREQKQLFDIIILDPPKFAPSQTHLEKAARAYKEINYVAMLLLKPGGFLWTFSCSGAMTLDHFRYITAQSARDARITAQVVKTLSAGSDHPSLPNFTEGEYLKGLLLHRAIYS